MYGPKGYVCVNLTIDRIVIFVILAPHWLWVFAWIGCMFMVCFFHRIIINKTFTMPYIRELIIRQITAFQLRVSF